LAKAVYLVDVNLLIARLFEDHEHHLPAVEWFDLPDLQWALCSWTEAGFLRYATRPGRLSMSEATGVLDDMARHAGFSYHPVAHSWGTLTKPFFQRLHGHRQITDAYLLGTAIHDGIMLATFDRGILHLAGEYTQHVHLLESNGAKIQPY
jgi:uncharacterized protein